jgi:hypothetical protein
VADKKHDCPTPGFFLYTLRVFDEDQNLRRVEMLGAEFLYRRHVVLEALPAWNTQRMPEILEDYGAT